MQDNNTSQRYQLIRKLGEGGMGTVYHAHDRLTGEQVALKQVITNPANLITNSRSQNPSTDPRLSLAHEFQMMASLRHPHVIAVQDYGFGRDGQPFFTMTLLEDAQTFVQASHQQSMPIKIGLTMQMLQALDYIHRRDVLHRDLKPSNVLVKNGRVYVVDFGLAEARDAGHGGGVAGTLAYMSPEVLMGNKPTQSSDLFALGVMLYEILTGKHPFIRDNITETITAILTQDPDWAILDVSFDLLWVMQKLLEKSPEDRYQTATEVMKALSLAMGVPLPPETSDIRESFLQAAQFVGREKELSELIGALKDIITASQAPSRADTEKSVGSLWLIGGESGVGKSRLVEEIRVRAMVQGAVVLRGQAISNGGMPYQLWRDLLRRMILGVDVQIETLSILKEILPDLPQLLDRPIPDFATAPDSVTFQKHLFGAVEEVFRKTLLQMPILLIAEDLQWASESLNLLKEISQLSFDLPLMVLGVYRDDERPNLPTELPTFNHISLKRLSTEEITRLSQSILGDMGQRPQVIDLLERETEGNVFFLVEVVRTLAEDAGSLADIGRATLPSQIFSGGIRRIVTHRLSRVSEWVRIILNGAAVAGRQIDRKVIAIFAPEIDIEAWLAECMNAAIFNFADGEYRFAHDKLREGVLALLSPEEIRLLNGQIAQAIENAYPDSPEAFAFALAQHYQLAENPQKEAHYAFIAAKQADGTYNHADSRRFYERLIAIHAEQYAPNPNQYLARVYHGMGRAYYGVSDFDNVKKWQTQSLEMATKADDLYGIAEAEFSLGEADFRLGNYDKALELTTMSKQKYEQLGDAKKIAYAMMSIGVIQARSGLLHEAKKTNEDCLARMRQTGDEIAIARAMNNYAITTDMLMDYEGALVLYHESLAIRRRINDRGGISYSLSNIGALLIDMKRHDEALTYLTEARRYMLPIGEKITIATHASVMGQLYLELKKYDESRYWQMESLRIRREVKEKPGLASTYKSLVQLELAEDNPSAAWEWLENIIALIDNEQKEQYFLLKDLIDCAYLIFKHIGDYAKALTVLIPLYHALLARERNVDKAEANIAELRDKLGDAYDDIRAKAELETLDTIIEKLRHEYKPPF
jgi:serine/threonine protein kinase/tetratricopeptide (TPR) repeat protein